MFFDKITALVPNVPQLAENEKLQFLLEEEHDAASATSFVAVCVAAWGSLQS